MRCEQQAMMARERHHPRAIGRHDVRSNDGERQRAIAGQYIPSLRADLAQRQRSGKSGDSLGGCIYEYIRGRIIQQQHAPAPASARTKSREVLLSFPMLKVILYCRTVMCTQVME